MCGRKIPLHLNPDLAVKYFGVAFQIFVGAGKLGVAYLLVAKNLWNYKYDFCVGYVSKPLYYAVACRAEAAGYVRRKLPPEH